MNLDEGQQPFASPEEALEHYGVKGMRWGVRKEDIPVGRLPGVSATETAARNTSTKAYMAAAAALQVEAAKLSPAQKAANVEKWRENFQQKFEPPETAGKVRPADKPDPNALAKAREKWESLSPEQKKKVRNAAIATAVVGGVVAYGAYASRFSLPSGAYLPIQDNPLVQPGEKIGLGTYLSRIQKSQNETMSVENFFRPEAFARESFTLDSGHAFQRISSAAENTFHSATYASADPDDFNRYACALGTSGLKRHLVEFTAKEPVKIPALGQVLDTMREELSPGGSLAHHVTGKLEDTDVLTMYKNISHQQWRGAEPEAFIKALKNKGFDGIVDEMDAGVFSARPLVLFSPEKMSEKTAKVLTRKDLLKSLDQLKEIPKPPGRAGYSAEDVIKRRAAARARQAALPDLPGFEAKARGGDPFAGVLGLLQAEGVNLGGIAA